MDAVAIVGASLAGVQAAQALRRKEFDGRISIVGAEPHLPYDRPPLSKSFLTDDEVDEDKLRLRPVVDPDQLGVDWHLGSPATALRRPEGSAAGDDGFEIELGDGSTVTADGLIVATGARARALPGTDDIDGVHVLRTLDDARALRATLAAEPTSVVVVGFGFIGAEVASSARTRGHAVTIVEAAESPMSRVVDPEAGAEIAQLHRDHGVDVRLGVGVDGFDTDGGRLVGVRLADGTTVEATAAVIGIGVAPNTEWLDGAGLTIDDGVVADDTCLAAPGIVVAGDVARWPNRRFGDRSTRVEQWDNAVEMGAYAATRLLAWAAGDEIDPYQPVPWFWSDQYDRKFQLAGVPAGRPEIVQGSFAEGRVVRLYVDGDRVMGALCMNRPRQAIMARQLIAAGAAPAEVRDQLA